jgi:hypothetical protein
MNFDNVVATIVFLETIINTKIGHVLLFGVLLFHNSLEASKIISIYSLLY